MSASSFKLERRWVQRPEGSNWGDFGVDDQLGSLNLISRERIRAAASEIRVGIAFGLSLPLDYPGGRVLAPHRRPPQLRSTTRHGREFFNYSFRHEGPSFCDIGCDDEVTLCTQYSTQWDGFAHIGYEFDANGDGIPEACYYNGYRANDHIRLPEDRGERYEMPLGIDAFAARPIHGRGILIDLAAHLGREWRAVRFSDIQSIMLADRIEVTTGDIVCFHTGFADELLAMKRSPDPMRVFKMCAALDGSDAQLLEWISSSGLAAIVADNFAVEMIAQRSDQAGTKFVPLHHHCLFKRGVPLGELWYLTDLANWLRAHNRNCFQLTAPPLRLPGAVGSPVTPVAVV